MNIYFFHFSITCLSLQVESSWAFVVDGLSIFVSYILARAKKLPSPLWLDFYCVITCFILMERPSPWVRSRENVFFSLFQYMSFTLSSYFGCFLRPVCGEEAPILLSKTKKLPVTLDFVFFILVVLGICSFSITIHLGCQFPLYFSSLRSPVNRFLRCLVYLNSKIQLNI